MHTARKCLAFDGVSLEIHAQVLAKVFFFHEFLTRLDLDIEQTRLLRHDNRGLLAWRRGGFQKFGCFASFQRRTPSPYSGAQLGQDINEGTSLTSPLATISEGLARAAALGQSAVVIVQPGEFTVPPETVIPANCALYGYDLRVTKLRLPIGQEENNMFLLSNGCKARGFTFTGLRHEPYTLAGGPPKKGWAFVFKPGEVITRSPDIADCSQLHRFSQDQLVLPIDKPTGNPLMPRGGGNLLADGSVLAPSSPLRSVALR